jgi:hypothetical protein
MVASLLFSFDHLMVRLDMSPSGLKIMLITDRIRIS